MVAFMLYIYDFIGPTKPLSLAMTSLAITCNMGVMFLHCRNLKLSITVMDFELQVHTSTKNTAVNPTFSMQPMTFYTNIEDLGSPHSTVHNIMDP